MSLVRQVEMKAVTVSSNSILTGGVLALVVSELASIWKVQFFFLIQSLCFYSLIEKDLKFDSGYLSILGLDYEYKAVNLVKGEQDSPGELCFWFFMITTVPDGSNGCGFDFL